MYLKKSACIEPMYSELPFLDRFRLQKTMALSLWNSGAGLTKIWMQ